MSFDHFTLENSKTYASQSLSSRAMSFDEINKVISDVEKSQSLSSRAMSFDENAVDSVGVWSVSIPFEQGDVFRQIEPCKIANMLVCLNPFRAGRCLST